jgi:type VI secretion system secreted protein Hcp
MATNIFLKISGIKGESTEDRHQDEIEVLSWSWGLSQNSSTGVGAGGSAGRANFNDLSFTHRLDKASPSLMRACATGEHQKEATLTQRRAGSGLPEFLILHLSEVSVTAVLSSASGADDGLIEQVSLQFATIDLEYKPQKADGSFDVSIHFKYDIRSNRPG